MTFYLYSANDNWAVSQRRKYKVNLRNAVIDMRSRKHLAYEAAGLFKNLRFFLYYQPVKRLGGRRKYKAMYSKGGILVPRPPTHTNPYY